MKKIDILNIISEGKKKKKEKESPIHTKKWERCVKKVKKNSPDVNPYAVCTDSIGYEGSVKKPHRRKDESTWSPELAQDLKAFHNIDIDDTTPIIRKGKLMEYINSKKQSLSEQRYGDDNVGYVVRGLNNPRVDSGKVFNYFEALKESGLVNMFGSSVFLTYTPDDLERFLYGERSTPKDIDYEIERLERDNDEGEYDGDIEYLEEKKENIEKLLSLQQDVRDILIRTSMKQLELENKEQSMENIQRKFDNVHKQFFKMWVSVLYD